MMHGYVLNTVVLMVILVPAYSHPQDARLHFKQLKTFDVPEAIQGIAVDETYFYAIDSRAIGKYLKATGEPVKKWDAGTDNSFIHLDGGVIVDDKLVAAHSNYPHLPMTSSVEIWDTASLEHIDSHSFGIESGSLTWIDRYDGFWWAVFAHYDQFQESLHKDKSWTTLIKFDDTWARREAWVFPDEAVALFRNRSNSGGSWGPGGLLYCTGHDASELYALRLPKAGSVLEFVSTIRINNKGQGIAWDRSAPNIIYAIIRSEKQVVVSELSSD